METYRVLWLSICVPLGVIGATVALAVSPGGRGVLVRRLRGRGQPADDVPRRARTGSAAREVGCGSWRAGHWSQEPASVPSSGTRPSWARVSSCSQPRSWRASPYAVKAAGRWLRSVRTPSTAQLDAVARAFAYASPEFAQFRAPELRDLTDEQLCKRWRASYRAAQRQQSSAVKLIAAVAERQMYLDELERRNSSGFAAWLAAGPQAAEDPLPYLNGDRVDAPAVDWDELTRGQG